MQPIMTVRRPRGVPRPGVPADPRRRPDLQRRVCRAADRAHAHGLSRAAYPAGRHPVRPLDDGARRSRPLCRDPRPYRPVALAVTTNLSFNFLRKPAPADLIADCRLLKLGKRLAVGEVSLFSEGSPDIVCHATGTYSIPEDERWKSWSATLRYGVSVLDVVLVSTSWEMRLDNPCPSLAPGNQRTLIANVTESIAGSVPSAFGSEGSVRGHEPMRERGRFGPRAICLFDLSASTHARLREP